MHADNENKVHPARLALTGEGCIFVGGRYASSDGRAVMRGQMYVRYFIPKKISRPYPLIFINREPIFVELLAAGLALDRYLFQVIGRQLLAFVLGNEPHRLRQDREDPAA